MTQQINCAKIPKPRKRRVDCFSELYRKRWGIEEAIKGLNHRVTLEHVTGLTQQVVAQDVAAKIVCDNLQAWLH